LGQEVAGYRRVIFVETEVSSMNARCSSVLAAFTSMVVESLRPDLKTLIDSIKSEIALVWLGSPLLFRQSKKSRSSLISMSGLKCAG
jgi:hypothetical protein